MAIMFSRIIHDSKYPCIGNNTYYLYSSVPKYNQSGQIIAEGTDKPKGHCHEYRDANGKS